MIKEYLLIEDTLYPMIPDGSAEFESLDSKVWSVYRGDELVGIITNSLFQPILPDFMIHDGMKAYFFDRDYSEEEPLDIFRLALQGDEVEVYDETKDGNRDTTLTESMHIQEALPNQKILEQAEAHQEIIEERITNNDIIQEARQAPLIDSLREQHESVHEITAIFGKSINEVIEFLTVEASIIGEDAIIGIHEDLNQRCIVMHESTAHRDERLHEESETRAAAMAKLSEKEKRALGIIA